MRRRTPHSDTARSWRRKSVGYARHGLPRGQAEAGIRSGPALATGRAIGGRTAWYRWVGGLHPLNLNAARGLSSVQPSRPKGRRTAAGYAEFPLPETFGFSEMSAVARFGTSEISVQARFRVRTFFRCAQVKNFFGLECPVSMVVVQPQDLSNWHAKGLKKYLLPQQALFCGNAGHTVW